MLTVPSMATGRGKRRRKPSIEIRSFRREDIVPAAELLSDPTVVASTLTLPYQEAIALEDTLRTPPEGLYRLVAELDGNFAGLGTVRRHLHPRTNHIGTVSVAVRSAARRQGVGATLLEELIKLSENWLGLHRLELDVWVDDESAIQLYRSKRFAVEGIARAAGLRDGRLVDMFHLARVREQLAYPRVTAEEAAARMPPLLPAGPDPSAN